MTNYNERLDEILTHLAVEAWHKMETSDKTLHELGTIAEAKQAITSLIKELVAEAKPELKEVGKQIHGDMDSFLHNQEAIWSEQYVYEFEQNLLKALDEK